MSRANSPSAPADRVALFSGGLDSASAAACFAREGVSTVHVSHYVNGFCRLGELLAGIAHGYLDGSKSSLSHAGFYMAPTGGTAAQLRETSRRSRPLLFLSFAAATAHGCGAGEICISENGPLALNLALNAGMSPSRHAHSAVLARFEGLVNRLFEHDRDLRVLNPFELRTKGEMTRVFDDHPELALQTVSCWNQQWAGRGQRYGWGHCGFCFPCLVRRASLAAAGIRPPHGHFDVDVRELAARYSPDPETETRLAVYGALLAFARRVGDCQDWRTFIQRFPAACEAAPTASEIRGEDWFQELFWMMRRFADEVLDELDDQAG